MTQVDIDLEEKIERCERLAQWLTDDEMRQALEELAEDYKARLKRRSGRPFIARRERQVGPFGWWQRRRSSLKFNGATATGVKPARVAEV